MNQNDPTFSHFLTHSDVWIRCWPGITSQHASLRARFASVHACNLALDTSLNTPAHFPLAAHQLQSGSRI